MSQVNAQYDHATPDDSWDFAEGMATDTGTLIEQRIKSLKVAGVEVEDPGYIYAESQDKEGYEMEIEFGVLTITTHGSSAKEHARDFFDQLRGWVGVFIGNERGAA